MRAFARRIHTLVLRSTSMMMILFECDSMREQMSCEFTDYWRMHCVYSNVCGDEFRAPFNYNAVAVYNFTLME